MGAKKECGVSKSIIYKTKFTLTMGMVMVEVGVNGGEKDCSPPLQGVRGVQTHCLQDQVYFENHVYLENGDSGGLHSGPTRGFLNEDEHVDEWLLFSVLGPFEERPQRVDGFLRRPTRGLLLLLLFTLLGIRHEGCCCCCLLGLAFGTRFVVVYSAWY